MTVLWTCADCARSFTRINQRHACGVGDRRTVLRGRPDGLVQIYDAIEAFVTSLGPVEKVARDRYVLLRSVRVFADLVVMRDAVRLAIHLQRDVQDDRFFKVVSDQKRVTAVAKLFTVEDWVALQEYVREAYQTSLR